MFSMDAPHKNKPRPVQGRTSLMMHFYFSQVAKQQATSELSHQELVNQFQVIKQKGYIYNIYVYIYINIYIYFTEVHLVYILVNFCDKIRRAHTVLARSKMQEKQNFLKKKFNVSLDFCLELQAGSAMFSQNRQIPIAFPTLTAHLRQPAT